jgi:O-antigen/teichoic acid export membrane protein
VSVVRGSLYTLGAQVLGAASTAGLGVFIARSLGAGGFGAYSLVLAFTMLVAPVADAGISLAAARALATAADRDVRPRVYANAFALKASTGAISCAAVYLLAGPIADAYGHPGLTPLFRAAAVALVGQGLLTFFWSTLIAAGRGLLNLVVVAVRVVAEVALTVAVIAEGHGAAAAVLARGLAHCGAAAVACAVVFARARDRVAPSLRGALGLGRTASGLAVVEIGYGALYQVDVVMIGLFMTPLAVGLYQAPLRVLTPVTYLGIAAASGLAPVVARERSDVERRRHVVRALVVLVLAEAVGAAILFVCADWIVGVFGRDFAASARVLRALTPYAFVAALAPLASLLVTYLGSVRGRVVVGVTALAADVVLDVLLIPRYGLMGAAAAADVAAVYYVGAHAWLVSRTLALRPLLLARIVGQAAVAGSALGALLAIARGLVTGSSALALAALVFVGAVALAARVVVPRRLDRIALAGRPE